MDSFTQLQIPNTPCGKSIRGFIDAQIKADVKYMRGIYSKDALFDGLMYQLKGDVAIEKLYEDFMRDFFITYRVESIAPANNGQWIILQHFNLKGGTSENPVVDVLSFDANGKISRIDNCYDTRKMPAAVAEDAKKPCNSYTA